MSSENKTQNIGLNKWQGNEYAKREDFVNDNLIIDREIKNLQTKTDKKVDKVSGKTLSTNDYTTEEKIKLNNIQEEANKYIHPNKHSLDMIVETPDKKIMTNSERTKLTNIQSGAEVNREISDSVISTSSTTNASSKAVKTVNDKIITLEEEIKAPTYTPPIRNYSSIFSTGKGYDNDDSN